MISFQLVAALRAVFKAGGFSMGLVAIRRFRTAMRWTDATATIDGDGENHLEFCVEGPAKSSKPPLPDALIAHRTMA
jgi:hypothetical protein